MRKQESFRTREHLIPLQTSFDLVNEPDGLHYERRVTKFRHRVRMVGSGTSVSKH